MPRELQRIVETVPVEILPGGPGPGAPLRGISQDLSVGGVFVRTDAALPVGTPCELLVHVVEPPLRVTARVVHVLSSDAARALGRIAGVGLVFDDLHGDRKSLWEGHIAELAAAQVAQPGRARMRVVVADGETRLLERLSTAFGRAGFETVTASSGAEALAACLAHPPDVVVTALHLPILDGLKLLSELGAHPDLASVPVVIMSEDAGDLVRLETFQRGAMDFVPKPFTVVELCIRARRLALARHAPGGRVTLRGPLSDIGLPTLLTMFELEKKTGVLAVTAGQDAAWLSFRAGHIVQARGAGLAALDWRAGHFEFTACEVDGPDEVGAGMMELLLEHARRRDESTRAS